jgi:hypothetical protein
MKERAAAAAFGGGSESAMSVAAPGLGEAGIPPANNFYLSWPDHQVKALCGQSGKGGTSDEIF